MNLRSVSRAARASSWEGGDVDGEDVLLLSEDTIVVVGLIEADTVGEIAGGPIGNGLVFAVLLLLLWAGIVVEGRRCNSPDVSIPIGEVSISSYLTSIADERGVCC